MNAPAPATDHRKILIAGGGTAGTTVAARLPARYWHLVPRGRPH